MTANEAPSTVIGVAPPPSVTETTTWYVPSSGSVKLGAVTVNWAALPFWSMLAAGTGPTTRLSAESKIEIVAV